MFRSFDSIQKQKVDDFELENTSVWSFPKRAKWATQKNTTKYRGNWAPQIPRNLILRYSHEGDKILDPFVGSGTTLIECKLLNRNAIGVDINQNAVDLTNENLKFESSGVDARRKQRAILGDARNLNLKSNSIDFIAAHPPYANIIKYSEDNAEDLSHLKPNKFIEAMTEVATELHRVLKPGKFCAILMGDARKNCRVIPLGFMTFNAFTQAGFIPKEIVLKKQHNCKATGFWAKKSIECNFLLLRHEYLFVFEKPKT